MANTHLTAEMMPELMNSIRNDASDYYRHVVPEADLGNYADVGNPIITYSAIGNEFINILINRIGLTLVDTMMYENPLKRLKKGSMPLGQDVQDIYVNPAKAEAYEGESLDVFKRAIPDVKAAIYRLNRKDKYKVTVPDISLQQAFISWGELTKFIDGIINSMYNGDNIDEYEMTKELMVSALDGGKMVTVTTADPTNSESDARSFVKTVRQYSGKFKFPSSSYNKSSTMYDTPAIVYTPVDRQILILPTDTIASIDVDVLARAFNMDKTDFIGSVIEVDALPEGVYGILADEGWFQIYDSVMRVADNYNGSNLSRNYWYHHWETFAFRPWANCVAFVGADYAVATPVSATIDPVDTTVQKGTSQQFNVSVVMSDGTITPTAVDGWSITTTGIDTATTISASGLLYVSPNETKTTIAIKATCGDDEDGADVVATTNVTII